MYHDEFRYHEGRVQRKIWGTDTWFTSAHNQATPDELETYEQSGHPAAPALREKFTTEGRLP